MNEAASRAESVIARLPKVRGTYQPRAMLKDLTWFRAGGPADVLFWPTDTEDLAAFLRGTPDDVPILIVGVGSNLLVRDGGIEGVVVRLGRGFAQVTSEVPNRIRAGAAALDVAVTPGLRQTLRRVLDRRTAVVVTHDLLDALLLADRVIVLDGGRIVEDGPSAEVLARPRSGFTARIAGLNLVRGAWRDGSVLTGSGLRIVGEAADEMPAEGSTVVAVFPPTAVSVFLTAPGGSPRNELPVTVTEIEPHGSHVRLRAGDLAADVTPRALAELDLTPGTRAVFAVKATEVAVYPI